VRITPPTDATQINQPATTTQPEPQNLKTQAAPAAGAPRIAGAAAAAASTVQQVVANEPAQTAATIPAEASEQSASIEAPPLAQAASASATAALANAQPSQAAATKTAPLSDAKGKASKSSGDGESTIDGPKPANAAAKSQAAPTQMRPAAAATEIAPPPVQAVAGEPTALSAGADSLGQAGAQSHSAGATGQPAQATPSALRAHTAAHLAAQITRRFDAGQTSFEVRLDPAELGRVDVRIDMTRNRGVHATISADSAMTLAELARASKDLERALADAGLDLAEGGLSFSLNDPGQQDFTSGRDASARSSYGQAINRTAEAEDMPVGAKPLMISRWAGAGLDVWA
jgi:flagellar hook-length control protein FliK